MKKCMCWCLSIIDRVHCFNMFHLTCINQINVNEVHHKHWSASCWLFIYYGPCKLIYDFLVAVSWLRRLVGGLSPRRPVFDLRAVPVRFLVDKVALGQVFLRVLRFTPASIIPPVLRTHLQLRVALNAKKKGQPLGTFQKGMLFRKSMSME